MTATSPVAQYTSSEDLIAELAALARRDGANEGLWPGLTIYRFTEPTKPRWDEIQSLSLGVVAQGRKAVTAEGKSYVYDQFTYLVLSSGRHLQCQILEASPHEPFLSLVLQIEPALVRKVSTDMLARRGAAPTQPARPDDAGDTGRVSALDDELMSAVLRFLRSLSTDTDRRVLAPLYLQETVYRVLQREQFARMLQLAARQDSGNPIAAALTYITANLAEPLTVTTLAERVHLSPSAFTRAFREATGRSPYQFIKELRLDRARQLLVEDRCRVAHVAHTVGYTSTSHFIKEFRSRFGATPRDYADANSLVRELRSLRSVAD